MRTTSITLGAAGASAWVPIDSYITGFGLAIGCTITASASLTYKVQYTHSDPWLRQDCYITRSTTIATVTLNNHGINTTTDSITIFGSGDTNLDGTYAVASVSDANTFTYTVANTGATVSKGGVTCTVFRVFDHASIAAKTGDFDGNIAVPVRAVRLYATTYASGKVTMTLNEGRK